MGRKDTALPSYRIPFNGKGNKKSQANHTVIIVYNNVVYSHLQVSSPQYYVYDRGTNRNYITENLAETFILTKRSRSASPTRCSNVRTLWCGPLWTQHCSGTFLPRSLSGLFRKHQPKLTDIRQIN